MGRSLTIEEHGRDGRVHYVDGFRSIEGYWQFGGNDVVVILSMGTREEWQRSHAWAMAERASVLRFVADEAIRQQAPSCTADIDDETGNILLRTAAPSQSAGGGAVPARATPAANATAFVHRYRNLREKLAGGLLAAVLVAGAALWMGKSLLSVSPASGVPLNETVRTETHVATLIQTTDPHLPELSGRGGDETTSIGILLIPLGGGAPQVVPVVKELSGNSFGLARIIGGDGRNLWFDAAGFYGVRLDDYTLVTPEDLRQANPTLAAGWWEDSRDMDIVDGTLHVMRRDRSAAIDVDPTTWHATATTPKPSNARFARRTPSDYLAAGFRAAAGRWLGLHSPTELASEFAPGKWVRNVESADDGKQQRRLYVGELGDDSGGEHHRIRDITPRGETEYLEAAFLRMDTSSEPVRLTDPDSALMIHTSGPELGATLVVSRVDYEGKVLWSVDTGLHRFQLQQILPGEGAFAFVGTRPPIPDKLSEPLVVLVDNATGKLTSHSLWR